MKKALSIFLLIIMFFIVYFLQANFFTWFTIAGIMPNLYVILVLFIGLFAKKRQGLILGLLFGFYIDIVLGRTVGVSAIALATIGILGEIFSKNFSKDSRITIMLMVIGTTAFFEVFSYISHTLINRTNFEILSFLRILLIELLFNSLITIIIYPIIKKTGYKLEEIFEDKISLTRYF